MDMAYSISLISDRISLQGYANPLWILNIPGGRSVNDTSLRFPFLHLKQY